MAYLFIQVSKIVGCELKRIGDLNYEFYRGACGTYNFPQERVVLCFSESFRSKCERLVFMTKLGCISLYKVMMDLYFTIKPIQRTRITTPPLQIPMNLLWLLVEVVQLLIRLKSMIFQVTHGPKLLTIHITISKLNIVSAKVFSR